MALFKGFDITIDLEFADQSFPSGATFAGTVAVEPSPARTLLGRVSTALGSVTRLTATKLQVTIAGAISAKAPGLSLHVDLFRTDGGLKQPLCLFKVAMSAALTQESEL